MTKPKNKASYSTPTDENPEWTAETFARSRPIEDLLPPEIVAQFAKRGRPKAAVKKVPVSLRLSKEVVEKFKATGPGWQTAIDDVLKTVNLKKTFAGIAKTKRLMPRGPGGSFTTKPHRPHAAKKRA